MNRPPATRLPKVPLLALTTAVFITALTETLPAGVLPGMSASLGVSESATGQTVTIYAIATALTTIPLAILTAKWRRKPLLLVTMALFAVSNTVTVISSDFTLTMIARFAAGVAAGLAWAMIAGYARRMVVPELQGKAIALVMTGIPAALGLGVPADYKLPLHDEPIPAAMSEEYQTPEAHALSDRIRSLDGFVFVTPEYNRGIPTPLKNAIDYLGSEFANKAAGIVTYGSSNGQIGAAALRVSLSTLGVATVQAQPGLNIFTDVRDFSEFTPGPQHIEPVKTLLEQVATWTRALNSIR